MTLAQGDVWWADLADPIASAAGFRRPVVVVQSDPLNASRLPTVVCVPVSTNRAWLGVPGWAALPAAATGLPEDSAASATQILTLSRSQLTARVGRLPAGLLDDVLHAIDEMLGR